MGFLEGNGEKKSGHQPPQFSSIPVPGRRETGGVLRGGPVQRLKNIAEVYAFIKGDKTPEELYAEYGTQLPNEIVSSYITGRYVLGETPAQIAAEIASKTGTEINPVWILSNVPQNERRARGYYYGVDAERKEQFVQNVHKPEADRERGEKLKRKWQDPAFREKGLQQLQKTQEQHAYKTRKKWQTAFGEDPEQGLQDMKKAGMTDEEIAAKTGYKRTNIEKLRRRYHIERTKDIGWGVTDEDRKAAQVAINNGYLAELSQREDSYSARRVVVIQERLVSDPPKRIREVAKEIGMSPEGVRQIQKRELINITVFNRRISPENSANSQDTTE